MREASSLVLAARLQAEGARVRAYDPMAEREATEADPGSRVRASSAMEAVAGADAVVLVTEWPEFRELDWSGVAEAMAGKLIVDGRNVLDPKAVRCRGSHLRGRGTALMQAIILAGGEGTRLRPLTSTVPKPVVPLVDRPFIAYMLEWLRGHGVDDVVMSCGFLASGVRNVIGDGRRVRRAPALRGGAAAARHRRRGEVRRVPARRALPHAQRRRAHRPRPQRADRQHEEKGARCTLALIGVEDPSAYGLVRRHDDGSVKEFLEKPSPDQVDTNLISAGAYVMERDVLSLIPPDTNCSIEREVFPRLVGEGLFGFAGEGYWLDIGTPQRYLQATFDILERNVHTAVGDRLDGSFLAMADGVRADGRVVPPALVEHGVLDRRGRPNRKPGRARVRRHGRPADDDRAGRRAPGRAGRRGLHG